MGFLIKILILIRETIIAEKYNHISESVYTFENVSYGKVSTKIIQDHI